MEAYGIGYYNYTKNRTSWGIDCSGYVGMAFGAHSHVWSTAEIPPASWHVKRVELSATKTEISSNLQTGDLLVFLK